MNSPVSRLLSKFFGDSERSTTLSKNIIGSLFLKGISIVVQLMLVPMTLTYLSKELYGIWLTISSVVLWLTFFDVGFSLGLKNRLAEAIARGNLERGRQLVSTTYVMLFAIFVPLGLICELIIPYFDWTKILNVDASYGPVLVVTMRILILSFVLQMIFNSISTILAAFQRVAFANSFTLLGNIISLIVIWLLIQFTEPSLINMALAISFVPVAVYIVSSLILFSGQLRAVRPSLLAFRKDAIGDIFSLGAKFFIIQIQLIIMQQATNLLISNISNPDFVAYYNIVYRYLGAAMMVFNLVLGLHRRLYQRRLPLDALHLPYPYAPLPLLPRRDNSDVRNLAFCLLHLARQRHHHSLGNDHLNRHLFRDIDVGQPADQSSQRHRRRKTSILRHLHRHSFPYPAILPPRPLYRCVWRSGFSHAYNLHLRRLSHYSVRQNFTQKGYRHLG